MESIFNYLLNLFLLVVETVLIKIVVISYPLQSMRNKRHLIDIRALGIVVRFICQSIDKDVLLVFSLCVDQMTLYFQQTKNTRHRSGRGTPVINNIVAPYICAIQQCINMYLTIL
jgi:hypothetical protein